MNIQIGDHLKVGRTGYSHHGLYIGDGKVIHYSGKADGLLDRNGKVALVTIGAFAAGAAVKIVTYANRRYSRANSVQRAKKRLGEQRYSVHENNCEHFVRWSIGGSHQSYQVDRAAWGTGGGFAASAGTTATQFVSGRGGSAVMSGLKSTGRLVGGGAARGLNVVAGIGALGGDILMSQTVLKDNDCLDAAERKARKVGRWTGRAAGFGASFAASSAVAGAATSGAVGGAAITSGLATIGGFVGGGMAAGVGLTVAAPALLTAGAGYGTYKLWQKFA